MDGFLLQIKCEDGKQSYFAEESVWLSESMAEQAALKRLGMIKYKFSALYIYFLTIVEKDIKNGFEFLNYYSHLEFLTTTNELYKFKVNVRIKHIEVLGSPFE